MKCRVIANHLADGDGSVLSHALIRGDAGEDGISPFDMTRRTPEGIFGIPDEKIPQKTIVTAPVPAFVHRFDGDIIRFRPVWPYPDTDFLFECKRQDRRSLDSAQCTADRSGWWTWDGIHRFFR